MEHDNVACNSQIKLVVCTIENVSDYKISYEGIFALD